MDQVNELIDTIKAHKMVGVTGASIMYSWIARWIQPLQKRDRFGFKYLGDMDPSQLFADRLTKGEELTRVQRVLLDVHTTPYVPNSLVRSVECPQTGRCKLPDFDSLTTFSIMC